MPAVVSRFQEGPDRKRRAHAKSRKGCGNCKLRRVKCDETRPQCRKCVSYGVSCNYDGSRPSLDLSAQGSFQVDFTQKGPAEKVLDFSTAPPITLVSNNSTMVAMANDSLNTGSLVLDPNALAGMENFHRVNFWNFTEADLEVMRRFQERTVMTIGTRKTAPTYRDCICQLAFTQPFLMHMILSLTLMHDSHLAHSPELSASYTRDSLQHWNMATKLFNSILSRPIPPHYRDAIWATGALLGATVFAYVENPNAEQAWPLKPSDPNDLDWLKLSEGKKAIWQIADPTRPDSVFRNLATEHHYVTVPQWVEENNISLIPDHLQRLFDVTPESNVKNNVYHLPLLILSRLQGMTPTHDNVLSFLYFMAYMTPEFRNLLEVKDPRALLLLGWWFTKLQEGELWWLTRRARVEGRAIMIWLERWYGGEHGLMEMFGKMGDGSLEGETGTSGMIEAPPPLMSSWFGRQSLPQEGAECPVQ